MVNRIWQYHFGRGIVRSPTISACRATGRRIPSCSIGWPRNSSPAAGSMKPMHRLILTVQRLPDVVARPTPGPWPPTRPTICSGVSTCGGLTAEEIRDSILAVSGNAESEDVRPRHLSGDSRRKCWPASRCRATGWGKSSAGGAGAAQRLHPRQAVAAGADPGDASTCAETDRSTPVRFTTTQPTQALRMLNSEFLNKQAGSVRRAAKQGGRRRRRRSGQAGAGHWPRSDRRPTRRWRAASV